MLCVLEVAAVAFGMLAICGIAVYFLAGGETKPDANENDWWWRIK